MKRRRFLTITIGVMVSAGLVFMASERVAQAAPPSKSTTNQSWDENLPSASRFTVLSAFGGAAVRDNNTGLVWEQAPDATLRNWGDNTIANATYYCVQKAVGGTKGWRLPSVAELASLLDFSLPAPFVPASVFTGVQSAGYWSATTRASDPTLAWYVHFNLGDVYTNYKTGAFHAWCVRGGMNADQY